MINTLHTHDCASHKWAMNHSISPRERIQSLIRVYLLRNTMCLFSDLYWFTDVIFKIPSNRIPLKLFDFHSKERGGEAKRPKPCSWRWCLWYYVTAWILKYFGHSGRACCFGLPGSWDPGFELHLRHVCIFIWYLSIYLVAALRFADPSCKVSVTGV